MSPTHISELKKAKILIADSIRIVNEIGEELESGSEEIIVSEALAKLTDAQFLLQRIKIK